MKLVKKDDEGAVFWLNEEERAVLSIVLDQYPVLKEDYLSLTKSNDPQVRQAAEELLKQALAEQKAENLRFKQTFLLENKHLKKAQRGWHLMLKGHEIERLLQVLNDVRLGLWYALDCPDIANPDSWNLEKKEKPEEFVEKMWMMEAAGSLEWRLIELLDHLGY